MANLLKCFFFFFFFFIPESLWCFSIVAGTAAAGDAIFSFDNKCNTTSTSTSTSTAALALAAASDIDNIDINCSLIFPPSTSPSDLIALYFRPIHFSGPSPSPGFSTNFSFSSSSSSSFSFFLTPASLPLQYPPSLLSLSFSFTPSHGLHHHSQSHINVTVAALGFTFTFPSINLNWRHSQRLRLHSWIDYDATLHRLQLRLAASFSSKSKPIFSYPINFSTLLSSQPILLGFAASSPHNSTLHRWTFVARHGDGAPFLLHSDPLNPTPFFPPHPPSQQHPFITAQPRARAARSLPWGLVLALIFAAACGAMLTFFALLLCFSLCHRHRLVAPLPLPLPLDYSPHVLHSIKCSCSSPPPPQTCAQCQLMPLPT